jgi:hypothetical protein
MRPHLVHERLDGTLVEQVDPVGDNLRRKFGPWIRLRAPDRPVDRIPAAEE